MTYITIVDEIDGKTYVINMANIAYLYMDDELGPTIKMVDGSKFNLYPSVYNKIIDKINHYHSFY